MLVCNKCGNSLAQGQTICDQCGEMLVAALCQHCGNALRPTQTVCPICNTPAMVFPNRRNISSLDGNTPVYYNNAAPQQDIRVIRPHREVIHKEIPPKPQMHPIDIPSNRQTEKQNDHSEGAKEKFILVGAIILSIGILVGSFILNMHIFGFM